MISIDKILPLVIILLATCDQLPGYAPKSKRFVLVFKNLKSIFEKKGYMIDWKNLEKQNLDQTINTLAMASPFSLEEKQILLESKDLISRKKNLETILKTYIIDNFNNTTLQ